MNLYLKRGLWLPWASKLCWRCVGRRNRGRGEKISFMMGWRWAAYISFLGKSCNLPVLLIIIFYYRYKLKINCVSHSQQGLKLFSNYYLWINLASISSACWGIIEVCVCVCLCMSPWFVEKTTTSIWCAQLSLPRLPFHFFLPLCQKILESRRAEEYSAQESPFPFHHS